MATPAATLTDADIAASEGAPATLTDADIAKQEAPQQPGFWHSLLKSVNPYNLVQAFGSALEAGAHPYEVPVAAVTKMAQDLGEGATPGQAAARQTPVVGPAIQQVQEGNLPGAAGTLTGTALLTAALGATSPEARSIANATVEGAKAAAPGVAKGAATMAAGEAMSRIGMPAARYLAVYPGGRMIKTALGAGSRAFDAARASQKTAAAVEDLKASADQPPANPARVVDPQTASELFPEAMEQQPAPAETVSQPPPAPQQPASTPGLPPRPMAPAPTTGPLANNPAALSIAQQLKAALEDPEADARNAAAVAKSAAKGQAKMGAAQDVRAGKLADYIRSIGKDKPSDVTGIDWEDAGRKAGVLKPSATTIGKALDLLIGKGTPLEIE